MNVVKPSELLATAGAQRGLARVVDQVLRRTRPEGTPFSKTRLGYVTAYDPATWTVTALVGDMGTSISGIPILGNVTPAIEAAGQFAEVSAGSKTEYTLTGMLMKGPQTVRIRKTADESINNSGVVNPDNELRFWGLAGRTYVFSSLLLLVQNSATVTVDIKLGWTLPSGASWSGGGPGPDIPIAAHTAGSFQATGQVNWVGVIGAAAAMIPYGMSPSATTPFTEPSIALFNGSIKMGATDGLCSLSWTENAPATLTTTVKAGSTLWADMTPEYNP